jgi:phosphate starvation-inducible PhoH-like protein
MELNKVPAGASDMAHIVLTFDNNKLAGALYGPFDENLARIEQKLGVDIRSKGNQLAIKGGSTAAEQARRALDYLYGLVQGGTELSASEVDGAVRLAQAADDQLSLPTMEGKGKLAAARNDQVNQISHHQREKIIVQFAFIAGWLQKHAPAFRPE